MLEGGTLEILAGIGESCCKGLRSICQQQLSLLSTDGVVHLSNTVLEAILASSSPYMVALGLSPLYYEATEVYLAILLAQGHIDSKDKPGI